MNGCVICTFARAGAGTVRVPLNRANERVTRAAVHRIQPEYSTEVSAPAPAFPSPPAASTQCKQPKRILKTICQPGGPLDCCTRTVRLAARVDVWSLDEQGGMPKQWCNVQCCLVIRINLVNGGGGGYNILARTTRLAQSLGNVPLIRN